MNLEEKLLKKKKMTKVGGNDSDRGQNNQYMLHACIKMSQ